MKRYKLCVMLSGLLMIALSANGQNGYIFNLNYTMGLPMGNTSEFTSNYSWRGISVEPRWFLSESLSAGLHVGWQVFKEKESGSFTSGDRTVTGTQQRYINSFPMLAEAHYYFGDEFSTRFYLGAGLGAYRTLERLEMGIFLVEEKAWQFGFSPAAGILLPLGGGGTRLHLGAKYHYALEAGGVEQLSWLGFHVGFGWLN